MKTKSILIVGSTHGNERLGDELLKAIHEHAPELLDHCDYIIGNPRAYLKNTRCTDHDLNRSYKQTGEGYEYGRAKEIEKMIKERDYNLVLDLHTMDISMGPCLIGPPPTSQYVKNYIKASHYENVLTLDEQMSGCSMVGTVQNAIAIEVEEKVIKEEAVEIVKDLQRYLAGEEADCKHYEYEMIGKILQSEVSLEEAKKLENYKYNEKIDGVPMLVGSPTYKKTTDYYGYKSKKPKEMEL